MRSQHNVVTFQINSNGFPGCRSRSDDCLPFPQGRRRFQKQGPKARAIFFELTGLGLSANSIAPNLHFTRAPNEVILSLLLSLLKIILRW